MEIYEEDLNEESLSRLGEEAVSLIKNRDYNRLVSLYDYAMQWGRQPAAAMEQDLTRLLLESSDDSLRKSITNPSITVKFFQPNEIGLVAVVECIFEASADKWIGLDLVANNNTGKYHLYLEDVYLA